MTIEEALRKLEEMADDAALADRQQWAVLNILLDIMESKGLTGAGHRRLIGKVKERRPEGRKFRLGVHENKYTAVNSEVDCAAYMHLCQGRCCAIATVELCREDLEEGELKFNIDEPYTLPKGSDNRCIYQDRETGGCGTYPNRPTPCRVYECRGDQRMWKDFDAKIPADPPAWLRPLGSNRDQGE